MRGNRSRIGQWIDCGLICCAALGLAWGVVYLLLHAMLIEADLRDYGRPVYSLSADQRAGGESDK